MTTREKLAISTVVVLLAGVVFLEYTREIRERAALEATVKLEDARLQQLSDEFNQREQELTRQLAAMERDLARAQKSPQEAIKILPAYLPPMPQPVATKPSSLPSTLHDEGQKPAEDVVIPAADVPALTAHEIECKECTTKLTACTQQVSNLEQQNDVIKKERDAALRTVKGGSFWRRTIHAIKIVAISVGIGVAIGRGL